MGNSYHMGLSVRGALNWNKTQLKKLFIDEETGKNLSAQEAKEALLDLLSEGKEVVPMGVECDNWDYKTGCKGHKHL